MPVPQFDRDRDQVFQEKHLSDGLLALLPDASSQLRLRPNQPFPLPNAEAHPGARLADCRHGEGASWWWLVLRPPVGASSRDGDRGLKKRPACWALPGIYALYSCASLRSMKTTPKVLWIEEGMVQSQLPHIERHQGFNLHGIGPRAEYLNIILWEQREPSQGHPRSTGARSFHKKPSAAWGGDEREGEARVIWGCSHQVWRLLPNQHKPAAGRKQGAKAWAAQSAQGSSCPELPWRPPPPRVMHKGVSPSFTAVCWSKGSYTSLALSNEHTWNWSLKSFLTT